MTDEIAQLRAALKAFLDLNWNVDGGPAHFFYVGPVDAAHEALRNAGILIEGRSPFPADEDGAIMVLDKDGQKERYVWIGGAAYNEHKEDAVPEDKREIFRKALKKE